MSLHESTPSPPRHTPYSAPLAPTPTPLARIKSRVVRDVVARVVPASVLVTRARPRHGECRIALTFDDGPDAMTPRYLDALDRLGVRATFFLIGENAAKAPDAVLEYVRRGHEVAAHGWSHEPFPPMGAALLVDELARTTDLLPPGAFARPLVRPPLGRVTAATLLRIAAAGYTTVLWSLDSDDCRTRDPRAVEAAVSPERLAPGEIILMHELEPWTLEALPRIVRGIRGAGFDFATVGELLGI
jgi:peptidoglycan/xylan/chitin deacetylase (PgdA/CDA1 family)